MWDDIYQTKEYVYGVEANDFLKQNAHYLPKGKVLCLADGEGRNSVFLAKAGYEVTAVDLSSVALKKAKTLAESNQVNINFIQADLATFDLGEAQWDAIVSIFCHLPLSIRQRLHKKIPFSLKPNGLYLMEGYTPKQLQYKTGGPPVADMMVTKDILNEELAQLNFFHLIETERYIQEGVKHLGMSHTVQAIGKKVR